MLGGEVAVPVVGEQLGQDQGAVEWRAQLVAHIGEELGLVLVRASQLVGFLDQIDLRARQMVALQLKRLGLLLELRVGLFQLGLLSLKPGLRLAQSSALLFQLLVDDPQFLLLGLQLLCLPLGRIEERLALGSIVGRAQRDAGHLRDGLDIFERIRARSFKKTQLDHPNGAALAQ